MSINLLDDVAPASNELGAIADMAQQMYDLQTEIIQDKESLKQKEQDLKKLAEQNLPDLMQELNIKDFTLNNGAKIKVDDIVSASIPSTGSIERADGHERMELEMRQQQCFDWLRANGGGELIKNNVEVQFGRSEDDECNDFTDELRSRKLFYKRAVGVHPAQLNAFVKERISDGKSIPHDLFKTYTGRRAKIRR
jgi:hypothetical protein